MHLRARAALLGATALVLFPTAAAAELNPRDLSPAGESASSPSIASDGNGTVVAVWREVDGDEAAVRAAIKPAGDEWGAGRRISVPAAATEAPRLAMDRLGNAVAVWHRSDGRDSVVQAAIRPAGGVWSAPQDLSAPGELASNADVSVEAGRATAVWAAVVGWRSVARTSSRTIAGSWAPPETISGPIGNAYAPRVAQDDLGGAVATWQWWDGAYLVVQAAVRAAPTGGWLSPETLSGTGRNASHPKLGVDARGNAVVGWLRSNGSWVAVQVASRPANGSWTPPRHLTQRGGNAEEFDLVVNRGGDAAVAWVQGRRLWSSFRPADAPRWSGRAAVTDFWTGLRARIGLDEAGNATAVWAGSGQIVASFKPAGDPWKDNYMLSSFDFTTAQPAVTMHAARNATAAWLRFGEEDDRIQAVAYDINTTDEEAEEGDEEEPVDEEGDLFRGSPGADRLVGTAGNDVFYGLDGNDVIYGRGGRDVVYGGPGDDRIVGGTGSDRLVGGFGRDLIAGERGSDVLVGGPGRDVLRGGSGNDALRARDQRADSVFGGSGLDRYRLDRWLDRARSIETRL